jgi:predicted transcriptional regulator
VGKKKLSRDLSRRERQIMDAVFQLGEASVAQIQERIPNAPSYSSVRTLVRLVESKGFLKHHRVGTKYIYSPKESKDRASRTAIQHVIATFFGDSASDAVAAILGDSKAKITLQELDQLEEIIEQARKERES